MCCIQGRNPKVTVERPSSSQHAGLKISYGKTAVLRQQRHSPDMLLQSLLLPLCSFLSIDVSLVQTQSRYTCVLPHSSSATGTFLSLHILFPGPIIPPQRKAVLWVISPPFQHWGKMANSLVRKGGKASLERNGLTSMVTSFSQHSPQDMRNDTE